MKFFRNYKKLIFIAGLFLFFAAGSVCARQWRNVHVDYEKLPIHPFGSSVGEWVSSKGKISDS